MKIHSTLTFNGLYSIDIRNINCSYESLNALLTKLNFDKMLVVIDSIVISNGFVDLLKSMKLKYICFYIEPNLAEIAILLPFGLKEIVLKKAVEDNPENIFIANLIKLTEIKKITEIPFENIIQDGFSDATVILARDKKNIHFCFNSCKYPRKEILRKIRLFDTYN